MINKNINLIDTAVGIVTGAGVGVSSFAVDLMQKREQGIVISRQDRVRMIVENATRQPKIFTA